MVPHKWLPRSKDDNIRAREYLFRRDTLKPEDQYIRREYFTKLLTKAKENAGIINELLSLYSIRHTVVYLLDQNGVGLNFIRCLLRHKDVRTIEQYLKRISSTELEPIVEDIKWKKNTDNDTNSVN